MKPMPLTPVVVALTLVFSFSAWAQAPLAEPSLPYTVTSRDKLIKLSRDLLVQPSAWPEVARLNKLKDPNLIRPGQVIQVPLRLLKFQPGQARVVSATGNVQLGGSPTAVGAPVPEGGKVQTGADSSAVLELADGTRVKVLPNSLAEVVSNRDYAMRDASKSGSTTWFSGLIRLAHGVLETTATRTQNRATPLQVETPTSLVGVRGTQFRVAYDDPDRKNARTEVVEGLVRADNTAQNSGADLPKGTGAVIHPAQREVRVVPLLAAPDLSALPSEVTKPQGQWPMPALPGAVAYRVQIAGDEQFNGIVRDIKVTGQTVDLGSLDTTRWYARVRGIDAQGLEGRRAVVAAILSPARRHDADVRRHAAKHGGHVVECLDAIGRGGGIGAVMEDVADAGQLGQVVFKHKPRMAVADGAQADDTYF